MACPLLREQQAFGRRSHPAPASVVRDIGLLPQTWLSLRLRTSMMVGRPSYLNGLVMPLFGSCGSRSRNSFDSACRFSTMYS